ncbi:MAG TPA: putative nucleotidyltransferase substrate binding domain-containing protein [Solirubrobacteraceae bacterium]|nr:putative nucleotidyltransferase substrate binding domain-containing protein [Solirubrobacteraceae bacterium]
MDTFLRRHPPFSGLDPDLVIELAANPVIRPVPAGEIVLVEDGLPADGMWVLYEGSMELVHQGQVVSVLEPGQSFGHPSLLTGMAPTFTVRARDASRCLWLDAATARRVLGTEAGAAFVAATMRERLTQVGHTAHGLQDVGTTPVSAIMRPAVFGDPEESVRTAITRLGEPQGTAALLLRLPAGELAMVTDADVRARLAAGTIALDAPVREIARSPVATVPIGQLAVEATVDMLAAGVEHLPVVENGQVCGLISAADLLGLDAQSPIGLRHTILGAPDAEVLERATAHLPALFLALARAGVPSRDLGRVLSLQHDAVVTRLIDFSLWRHGPAPELWAFLDLGSAARREFTLASDQDNGLAYAQPAAEAEAETDTYFARLGQEVNAGLTRCGIATDNNGVLAGDRRWRMSAPRWLTTFDECLTVPDESHLIRATVAFDFRTAAGGLELAPQLTARIRAAREHGPFMRLMARAAAGFPVALGFRGQLSTGADGRLDIKRGGVIPLVNLVRYHALANGVSISSTQDRIEAVTEAGGLPRADGDALAEAFAAITAVRFDHHAARIAAGEPVDNMIDPAALAPLARGELREALAIVRRAQKRLPV